MSLYAEVTRFANEAVCPVNENGTLPGFVAGAYEAWGRARIAIKSIAEQNRPSIPADAICFFKDGNKWCCVNADFVNLQESPAGFGDTFEEALAELQQQLKPAQLGGI